MLKTESVIILLAMAFFTSCNSTSINNENQQKPGPKISTDTLVGRIDVTSEVAGNNYINRASAYFTITNGDTSLFTPVFKESKDKNSVELDMNLPYRSDGFFFEDRMTQLKLILPVASNDYNLDSLKVLSFGRLILTGDMAIDATEQYVEQYGIPNPAGLLDNEDVAKFMSDTELAKEINKLLQPYELSVDRFFVEKSFFTSNTVFESYGIQTDVEISSMPDSILDCQVWVRLKNM